MRDSRSTGSRRRSIGASSRWHSGRSGRPALPIRRIVGLLLLKQLFNLSAERVVEQWPLNPYFQFFLLRRARVSVGRAVRGLEGGAMNLLLAATASNLRLWPRRASACLHAIVAPLVLLLRSLLPYP